MTFPLTPERLQSIAVDCVSKFMNKEASLSEAIAKEAQDLELNSDQTQRVIEASNTIAYLRQLEKSADRTFEFEVADYNRVMSCMCIPEDMHKVAKDKDEDEDKKESKEEASDSKKEESKDEDEKESKAEKNDEREGQEKKAMLMQGYFKAKHELTKMAYDKAEMHMTLSNAIAILRKDPYALEKLAFVTEEQDFEATASLCALEKRAQFDNMIFTNVELSTANNVLGLYKQASAMLKREEDLQTFIKRSEAVLFQKTANVEKLAGIGEQAMMGTGRLVGSAIGGMAKGIGNAGRNIIKTPGAFSRASADRGFASTKDGVRGYDKMVKTKGVTAASNAFKGAKPSVLFNRIGTGGILTALAGTSINHKNNIKDL